MFKLVHKATSFPTKFDSDLLDVIRHLPRLTRMLMDATPRLGYDIYGRATVVGMLDNPTIKTMIKDDLGMLVIDHTTHTPKYLHYDFVVTSDQRNNKDAPVIIDLRVHYEANSIVAKYDSLVRFHYAIEFDNKADVLAAIKVEADRQAENLKKMFTVFTEGPNPVKVSKYEACDQILRAWERTRAINVLSTADPYISFLVTPVAITLNRHNSYVFCVSLEHDLGGNVIESKPQTIEYN